MLKKMYLTNFLSFMQRTAFDFNATKYTILSQNNVSKSGILKGAMFVGANASGKTNALKGIGVLLWLIKGEGISLGDYRCHFSSSPLTELEYEFLFDDENIVYKIGYDAIKNELRENLTIGSCNIMYRDGKHGELHLNETSIVENSLDPETLFFRTASFNTGRFPQNTTLHKLADYLINSYYIDEYNRSARLGKSIYKYVDENGVDKINEYLSGFNYDFSLEYGFESEGAGYSVSFGNEKKHIFFKRNGYPIPIEFSVESQGNQVFSDFLPQMIQVIENNGMLIVDEFGNSLHNKLAEKIIGYFMKNAKESQLFISSHDKNLISNSVFRPDQINVVSFENKIGSVVNIISKFRPREAQNLEKMYLGGMFEGLPDYGEKIYN